MSKRVANKKHRPLKHKRCGRWLGHMKVGKYTKRRPLVFDPVRAVDELIGKA